MVDHRRRFLDMRFRFSLRTIFILIVVAALFCYVWFIRPSRVAQNFVNAVAVRDYQTADRLFTNSDDKFIVDSSNKYWGYQLNAVMSPVGWGQLLRGRRNVEIRFEYFYLDQRSQGEAEIPATPLGMGSPVTSEITAAVIIDRNSTASLRDQSPPQVSPGTAKPLISK